MGLINFLRIPSHKSASTLETRCREVVMCPPTRALEIASRCLRGVAEVVRRMLPPAAQHSRLLAMLQTIDERLSTAGVEYWATPGGCQRVCRGSGALALGGPCAAIWLTLYPPNY